MPLNELNDLNDFQDIFRRLHVAGGRAADGPLDSLLDAIFTTYQAVSRPSVELADLLRCSGTRPSGIPLVMFRHLDQARAKLRMVLLDSPPNSLSVTGISQNNKVLLFATLEGALDAVRELFDSTDPTRQLAEIDYWIAWVKMETSFAIDDVKKLLYQIAYSIQPEPPAYPYRPIPSPNGFRLLVVHPSVNPESDIRCVLLHETDYSKRSYAALSYVWGDLNAPRVDIVVNGTRFPVTSNLRTALKHFRHSTRRRVLWVDAICINQEDKVEKNKQVSSMASIYRSAAYILMWVGEANNDARYAMQWLREVQKEGRLRVAYSCSNDTVQNHWPEIWAFFRRPYWRRVWILQEAISKDDSLVCCGAYAITWSALRDLVLHWLPDMQDAMAYPDTSKYGDNVVLPNGKRIALELGESFQYLRFHADFTEKRIQDTPIPFLNGLVASRSCSASNPRDYVYGIAGFVSNCPVNIDYNKSVYRLYLDMIRNVIRRTAKLDILTACKDWTPDSHIRQLATLNGCNGDPIGNLMRRFLPPRPNLETMTLAEIRQLLYIVKVAKADTLRERENQDDDSLESLQTIINNLEELGLGCLPSWVPRWDWKVKEPYLLLNQENPHPFNASSGTAAQFTFGNFDCEMTLRGIQVDVVRGVKTFPQTTANVTLRQAWDFWAQEGPMTLRYPNLEDQREAFCNTFMRRNNQQSQYRSRDNIRDFQHALFALEMGWIEPSESTIQSTISSLRLLPDDISKAGMKYAETIPQIMTSQAFLVGENGHIGLGPLATKSGDLVCVLNGGDVPFILRPAFRGNYYLMGEACES
jgi:hypothetical protein